MCDRRKEKKKRKRKACKVCLHALKISGTQQKEEIKRKEEGRKANGRRIKPISFSAAREDEEQKGRLNPFAAARQGHPGRMRTGQGVWGRTCTHKRMLSKTTFSRTGQDSLLFSVFCVRVCCSFSPCSSRRHL
ncbi:hypothetical protein CEXT_771101 [Caerostris extrusa]|uniref:Uncharacterized protein n=1 Tax=Caerostris extrusa TaxID=172846 RepID=A0AAV4PNX2_CAEEX|nr:hypothetical protein CEXT_771101 [Caerostris extrusa]